MEEISFFATICETSSLLLREGGGRRRCIKGGESLLRWEKGGRGNKKIPKMRFSHTGGGGMKKERKNGGRGRSGWMMPGHGIRTHRRR